jgi:hypothetical protein
MQVRTNERDLTNPSLIALRAKSLVLKFTVLGRRID